MSAPVLVVPPSYPIAARPRAGGLFDTEVFAPASSISSYFYFQSTWSFLEPGFGRKTLLDTNFPGVGGSLPRGYYFRWFGLQSYLSQRQNQPTTAAEYDDVRKLASSSYTQIMLGATPYMTIQGIVDSGTGLTGPLTSGEPLTIGSVQLGWPSAACYADFTVPALIRRQTSRGVEVVRVPRVPIELAETESFAVNLTFPERPGVTNPIWITLRMRGVTLKPLAA
jgi:hypothetical protein